MTFITESLISECQSRRTISLNKTINEAFLKTAAETQKYNMQFCITNPDTKKLLINNLIISICNFKKSSIIDKPIFYINSDDLNFDQLYLLKEVLNVMEIFNSEKSNNFFNKFMKYIKKNNLKYLKDIYFKQVSNKLALFK
jgi:hypothetical protein